MTSENTSRVLRPEHLQLLADRGISEAVAIEHGLFSIDLAEEKRLRDKYPGYKVRFPYLPLHETTGLAQPYPTVPKDGIPRGRVRADITSFVRHSSDDRDQPNDPTIKIPRYITQAAPATVIPYIPPAVRRLSGDTTQPIYIVEAPLKALSLVAHGMPAIGLGGVLAGAHDTSLLKEYGEIGAHPMLRDIDWRGRCAILIFDASLATNPMVALGLATTALALERIGATVWVTRIPYYHAQESDPINGIIHREVDQGPDDHLVRLGVDSLRWHVFQSVPASPLARVVRLAELHTGPNLTNAITELLKELHVLALLDRDPLLIDRLAAVTKKYGVGVQSIKRAVGEFRDSLKKRVKKLGGEDDKRRTVYVSTNEAEVNDEIVTALRADPNLFQRGRTLVGTVTEPAPPPGTEDQELAAGELRRAPGAPVIVPLRAPALRERITRYISLTERGDEEDFPVHPEGWMAPAILARGVWHGLPQLTGIVQAPTLRADCTILQTPGYDAATGLLYVPSETFPTIPEKPTEDEARAAIRLLHEPIAEYQFESDMHRAAAIAAMITPLARSAIQGPVPVTVVDAPKRGVGKTMLVDLMSIIATGHDAAKFAYSSDDSEVKKALLAIVLGGDQFLLVDNVPGRFGGPVWDAFLTAFPTWKDRVLGVTGTHEGPNLACVFVTGNAVTPLGDTARRALHIRLVTNHERPDTRDDFKVKDLRAHVRANRVRYVVAALTIIRAYIAAPGRPEVTKKTWGTFEHWHRMIARPLIWLGLPDPSETRIAFEDQPSSDSSKKGAFLRAWYRCFGAVPKLAATVIREVVAERAKATEDADEHLVLLGDAIANLCPAKEEGVFPSPTSLGKKIGKMNGAVDGGYRIVQSGADEGTALWSVERVAAVRAEQPETAAPATNLTNEDLDEARFLEMAS